MIIAARCIASVTASSPGAAAGGLPSVPAHLLRRHRPKVRNRDCGPGVKYWTLDGKEADRPNGPRQTWPGAGSPGQSSAPGRIIMTTSSRRRGLVLAGTLGTLLVATWPVAAQQPAPLPPGS